MHQFIKKNGRVFPNIEIALRIYLSMWCSNCSGEGLLSKLVKDNRLSALGIMKNKAKILNIIEFS